MADYREFDKLIGVTQDKIGTLLGKPNIHYFGLDIYVNPIGILYISYAPVSSEVYAVNGYALFSDTQHLLRQVGIHLLNAEETQGLTNLLEENFDEIKNYSVRPVAYIGSGISVLGYLTDRGTMFLINSANKTTTEFLPKK